MNIDRNVLTTTQVHVGLITAIALARGLWIIASGTAAEFWRAYTTPVY